MRPCPDLDSARLLLRAHRREDFEALAAMWADPEVVRHIGGRVSSRQEAWFRLLRYGGLWPLLGFGYWAVTDRNSGAYLGDIGLADFERGLGPGFDGVPEMGWALVAEAAGRGLATEAGRAVLAFADKELGLPRTVCMIDPDNLASIAVARKLGFVAREEAAPPPHAATLTFERLRPPV